MRFLATVLGLRLKLPKEPRDEPRVQISLEVLEKDVDLNQLATLSRGPLLIEIEGAQLPLFPEGSVNQVTGEVHT